MSDSEANKAFVRRYFDMFNSGDLSQLAGLVSQDYGDKLEEQSSGIGTHPQLSRRPEVQLSRFHLGIEQVIGEGDRVTVINRVSGTHM